MVQEFSVVVLPREVLMPQLCAPEDKIVLKWMVAIYPLPALSIPISDARLPVASRLTRQSIRSSLQSIGVLFIPLVIPQI